MSYDVEARETDEGQSEWRCTSTSLPKSLPNPTTAHILQNLPLKFSWLRSILNQPTLSLSLSKNIESNVQQLETSTVSHAQDM